MHLKAVHKTWKHIKIAWIIVAKLENRCEQESKNCRAKTYLTFFHRTPLFIFYFFQCFSFFFIIADVTYIAKFIGTWSSLTLSLRFFPPLFLKQPSFLLGNRFYVLWIIGLLLQLHL